MSDTSKKRRRGARGRDPSDQEPKAASATERATERSTERAGDTDGSHADRADRATSRGDDESTADVTLETDRVAPVHPAPTEGARTLSLAIGIAFLLLMVAIPLRYYLGDDRYDERFAWRMFSAVRVERCESEVTEEVDGARRPIALRSVLPEPWIQLLSRNRPDVVWRFLEWQCEESALHPSSTRVVNRCVTPAREPVPPREYVVDCATHTRRSGEAEEAR